MAQAVCRRPRIRRPVSRACQSMWNLWYTKWTETGFYLSPLVSSVNIIPPWLSMLIYRTGGPEEHNFD
jgi:hypothetical protein